MSDKADDLTRSEEPEKYQEFLDKFEKAEGGEEAEEADWIPIFNNEDAPHSYQANIPLTHPPDGKWRCVGCLRVLYRGDQFWMQVWPCDDWHLPAFHQIAGGWGQKLIRMGFTARIVNKQKGGSK